MSHEPAQQAHPDLDSRAHIHDLVVAFYREVAMDDLLGPIFEEVAEVDWTLHIPRLIDYWCRVLLGEPVYDGRILGAHRRVHDIEPLRPDLFQRWCRLFDDCLDERWAGPIAVRAKSHAARMADTIARSLSEGSTSAAPEMPSR
jgi:hemoglobin